MIRDFSVSLFFIHFHYAANVAVVVVFIVVLEPVEKCSIVFFSITYSAYDNVCRMEMEMEPSFNCHLRVTIRNTIWKAHVFINYKYVVLLLYYMGNCFISDHQSVFSFKCLAAECIIHQLLDMYIHSKSPKWKHFVCRFNRPHSARPKWSKPIYYIAVINLLLSLSFGRFAIYQTVIRLIANRSYVIRNMELNEAAVNTKANKYR